MSRAFIQVRCSIEEKENIKTNAKDCGLTVSSYLKLLNSNYNKCKKEL